MNHDISNLEDLTNNIGELDLAEIRPVKVGEEAEPIDPYVAIHNTSRNTLETIVQKKHSALIQHKEAFTTFVDACKEKNVAVEGVLKDFGGKVVVEVHFPEFKVGEGDDKLSLGVRLENSYNGSYPKFSGEAFGFMHYCNNGMHLGKILRARFSAKHVKVADLQKNMLEFIGLVFECSEDLRKVIEASMEDKFEDEDELIQVAFGVLQSKKKVKQVKDLITKKDELGTFTRYQLYNAITNYATHQADNERVRTRVQKQAQKILATEITNLRHEAMD